MTDDWTRAIHEAGHALAAARLLGPRCVASCELLPDGDEGGRTTLRALTERAPRLDELRALASVGYAGMAAEGVQFGASRISAGCASDIARVTDLLMSLVASLGAGRAVGAIALDMRHLDDATRSALWADVRAEGRSANARAFDIVASEPETLVAVARALVSAPRQRLTGRRLDVLLAPSGPREQGTIPPTTSGVAVDETVARRFAGE